MSMEFLLTDLFLTFVGIILFSVIVFLAETERMFFGILALIGGFLILNHMNAGAIWTWAYTHPFHIVGGFLLYLVFGAMYTAFWKWRNYCSENPVSTYSISSFKEAHPTAPMDEFYEKAEYFDLHPLNHVYRLTNWMLMWPFSLFWTLLHDPLTWLGHTMYDLMGNVFWKIAVSSSKRKP